MISRQRLWQLRNELPIDRVLEALDVETKERDGYLRFLCPLCRDFNTAVNPRTNLARCFRCERNFNTIDLALVVKKQEFRDVVAWLSKLLV